MRVRSWFLQVVVAGLFVVPAFAQFRIDPNDDVTFRSTTRYNASPPFGLFVKGGTDVCYLEFTLGGTTATDAKLVLWQGDTGVSNPWTIVVKGQEFDFDETSMPGASYNVGFAWPQVGTFTIGTNPVQAFYEMDLTAWYNANLGKTMSLFMTRNIQPGGSGPIFEDKEGTKTGDAATYGPRIEWVPEPASLLLLVLGAGLIRRRRA